MGSSMWIGINVSICRQKTLFPATDRSRGVNTVSRMCNACLYSIDHERLASNSVPTRQMKLCTAYISCLPLRQIRLGNGFLCHVLGLTPACFIKNQKPRRGENHKVYSKRKQSVSPTLPRSSLVPPEPTLFISL